MDCMTRRREGRGRSPCRVLRRVCAAIAVAWACTAIAADPPRPNVLVIITDDHGHGDVSCYGATDTRTPHIDGLAAEGMLFTTMRANATVCSPSRAALLTGRHPDRVGVPGVIRTEPAASWGHFAPGVSTLADELRATGYHTAIVGKWHLGLEPPNTPNDRGFDRFDGFLGDMMDSYTTHLRGGLNFLRRNRDAVEPEGHATEIFSDWAVDQLRERARSPERPFFLYLAYNAPHFPMEPPAAWLDKVRQRLPEIDERRAKAVAMVEHLDDCIGRVLAALRETGLDRTTLVAFTADNGGSLPHGQSNRPWRDGKTSHYDGGLRVPFIVRWPGRVPPGSRCGYAGQSFDLFPTCLELAGRPRADDLDAVSLVPLLRGETLPAERDLYFTRREGGRGHDGKSYECLIRGRWKLMQNDPYRPLELYDLEADPQEMADLAAARAPLVRELAAALQRHVQRGGGVPWQPPPTAAHPVRAPDVSRPSAP